MLIFKKCLTEFLCDRTSTSAIEDSRVLKRSLLLKQLENPRDNARVWGAIDMSHGSGVRILNYRLIRMTTLKKCLE